MSEIRVRFAPSPTGYLHVGGARTALFNWLFARCHAGKFILRIEDTDLGRSSAEMSQGILDALRWMGLDWDEGPFFQSQRLDLYRQAAQRVLESGHAYRCYCSRPVQEMIGDVGENEALAKPRATQPGSPRDPCRDCRLDDAAGRRFAIRFLVPAEGSTSFDDVVFGHVEFANSELEDFVLLRSDGMPTYHLSVVMDDIDMRLTHVVRGADHLSNTPKQVLLYRALGAPLPVFAHVPLILGPDRTRLSKRHGATSVTAYREQGILPGAFRNFLALLGWSAGGDKEIFSLDELIRAFSLEGISKSNAVFNFDKLLWFNQQYIQMAPAAELFSPVREALRKEGLWRPEWDTADGRAWAARAIDLLKPRLRTLADFARVPLARAFFAEQLDIDAEAAKKFWKDDALATLLPELASRLEGIEPFGAAETEVALRAFAEERGVKAGVLINASRVALTGQAVAPGMFDVMAVMGRERTVARLRNAIVHLAAR